MLRTGLLPLNRRASAPSTLEMLESHTPQSYHSAGHNGGHDDYEMEAPPDAAPAQLQRGATVR